MDMNRANITGQHIRPTIKAFVAYVCLLAITANCNATELETRMKKLEDQYRNIPPIHFEANQTITFDGPADKRVMKTVYTYWGQEEKYRTDFSFIDEIDPKNTKTLNFAYNGQRFQRLDLSGSILNYRKEDINITPGLPHNPMIYPLIYSRAFLLDPKIKGTHLRLKDLDSDSLWNSLLTNSKVIQHDKSNGTMMVELSYKGNGDQYTYHLHFGKTPDYIPQRVDVIAKDGKTVSIVTINEFQSVESQGKISYWPKVISFQINMPDGKILLQSTVTSLELSKELPPGIFDLDFARADVVWDDDLEIALKTPRGNIPYPEMLTHAEMSILNNSDPIAEAKEKIDEAENHKSSPHDKNLDATVASQTSLRPKRKYIMYFGIGAILAIALTCTFLHGRAKKSKT